MVKGKGAKEREAGRVVDETRFTDDEIGGAGVGIDLIEMKIGGRGDIFWEYGAIQNTTTILHFDDCRPALGPNSHIAAQAEAAAVKRGIELIKLVAADGDVANITTGLALGADGNDGAGQG